ncbi:hypothetical protein EQM06_09330 [Aminipila luticellarii]|uniref:Uncharacterized protein n=2 Tax=Aminipila luticellarii TaxID=2507160 RepID=A0A410PWT2_9FIRM|nr:hypothetical protein EQM06_09330 [Aminipila luticellarii]
MKKLRNILVALGIMVALLPAFLYYTQHSYYGLTFSLITTFSTVGLFILASVIEIITNRKEGKSIAPPLVVIAGFVFLAGYILFRLH